MHQCDILVCYVSNWFFYRKYQTTSTTTNNNNKPSYISIMDGSDENISKQEDRNDEDELRQPFGC